MQAPRTGSFRRHADAALAACPVGLAPLAWPRLPSDLPAIARLGYDGIQVDGGDPETWAGALDGEGLRAAEVYVALPGDENGPEPAGIDQVERVEFAARCGADLLVIASDGHPARDAIAGRVGDGPSLTDTGWERLVDTVEAVERAAAERALPVAFHPHAGTWVETPGEIARLLAATPSLPLCLDTGHHLVGGGDPVAAVERYGGRLTHLHLKDVDSLVLDRLRRGEIGGLGGAVAARLFAPIGSGLLDLAGVVDALARIGYSGWLMVEQDTAWEPPVEAAAISRRVLEWACRNGVRPSGEY